jgi:predicted nucleotidyltransferase
MHRVIAERERELAEICRQFHVARLEVFGSAATGEFAPEHSDLDFVVTFASLPAGQRFDTFFGLQQALQVLFGRPVDLVEAGAPRNPYFIRRLNESRKVVYAA